jgi:hypothetical protein
MTASTAQAGIFALGTASPAYLEFDASGPGDGRGLVAAIASLREPRTTMGGVNLVAGFRPELWRDAAPADAPPEVRGFDEDLAGGTVTDHGTMFVGFSARQEPLATMLESMAGLAGGTRDALTRYTRPVTGAYYVVPSTESLRRVGGDQGSE